MVKSVWLAVFQVCLDPMRQLNTVSHRSFFFQESPFKLDVVGKDFYDASIVSIDFLASEGSMTFSATDDQGDLRLLEFDTQRRLLVSEALPQLTVS